MAVFQSVKSGFYDDPSTWSGESIPGATDQKWIRSPHIVTIRGGGTVSISALGAQALWIEVGATLRVISGGWVCQDAGCEVDIDGVLRLEGGGGIQWAASNTFEGSSGTGRVVFSGPRCRTYRGKNGMQHLSKFTKRVVL